MDCVYLEFEGGGIQILKGKEGRIETYDEKGTPMGSFSNLYDFYHFLTKLFKEVGEPFPENIRRDIVHLYLSL